jgi:GntR family transcriptional regulator of vanillate catabolism
MSAEIVKRTLRFSNSPAPSASQSDRVTLMLREMVLTGAFATRRRLTELDLVGRLNASRTPIRHALSRLAHEGLLERVHSGGYRVRAFAIEDVWDAIEIRGVLEGTAARLAAERYSGPDDLAEIRVHLQRMEALLPLRPRQYPRFLEHNDRFHRALWQLSKSRMVVATLEGILSLPFAAPSAHVFIQAAAAAHTAEIGQEHHRRIVEAIAAHEGARAEALAREHSHIARRIMEHSLRDARLSGRVPGATLINLSRAD